MAYDWKDVGESSLGSFVSLIFFYLLRSNDPISVNPIAGLILGLIWIWIVSYPLIKLSKESRTHLIGNFIVCLVINAILSLVFNMVTFEQLLSLNFYTSLGVFGSSIWLGILISLPISNLFDKRNILNIYKRYYSRR